MRHKRLLNTAFELFGRAREHPILETIEGSDLVHAFTVANTVYQFHFTFIVYDMNEMMRIVIHLFGTRFYQTKLFEDRNTERV